VADLATALVETWGSGRWTMPAAFSANVEANTLRIAIDKAVTELAWQPRRHLHQTIHRTVDWYQD
jgi:nucleoside-diphosphate-sugar epimerase